MKDLENKTLLATGGNQEFMKDGYFYKWQSILRIIFSSKGLIWQSHIFSKGSTGRVFFSTYGSIKKFHSKYHGKCRSYLRVSILRTGWGQQSNQLQIEGIMSVKPAQQKLRIQETNFKQSHISRRFQVCHEYLQVVFELPGRQ